jgi:hypothetical protein
LKAARRGARTASAPPARERAAVDRVRVFDGASLPR